jgi:hypothetical protein
MLRPENDCFIKGQFFIEGQSRSLGEGKTGYAMTIPPVPRIPVSWGELIDKLTILEIKTERLSAEEARANASREFSLLREIAAPILGGDDIKALVARLKTLNEKLWEIEDRIRDHERAKDFGADFIELARAVYKHNDERGQLKRNINLALGSGLIEEKSYRPY